MALTLFTPRREPGRPAEGAPPLDRINRAIHEARRRLEAGEPAESMEGAPAEGRAIGAAAVLVEVLLPPLESARRILERASRDPAGKCGSAPVQRILEKLEAAAAALGKASRMCRAGLEGAGGKEGDAPSAPCRFPGDGPSRVRPGAPDSGTERTRTDRRASRVRRCLDEVVYQTGLLQLNARVEGAREQAMEGSG